VDSRVTCCRRAGSTTPTTSDDSNNLLSSTTSPDMNWVYTTSHRTHSHDVSALAICSSSTPVKTTLPSTHNTTCPLTTNYGPLLLSGGIDTKVSCYYIHDFMKYRPTTLFPTPSRDYIQTSNDGNVVVLKHRHSIDIWRVNYIPVSKVDDYILHIDLQQQQQQDENKQSTPTSLDDLCHLQGEIKLTHPHHLSTMAINCQGNLLVASSMNGTSMWLLSNTTTSSNNTTTTTELLIITKVDVPLELKTLYCILVKFSNDGTSLACISNKGVVYIFDINNTSVIQLRDVLDHRSYAVQNGSTVSDAVCIEMVFNMDGQWLAVSTVGKRVCIYDMDR
jgi:WD40 repeat protein